MINIQDITPFMKKGSVAMNASGDWWWFCENHLIKVKDVHQFHYVGERCKWNIPLKIKYIWLILWG